MPIILPSTPIELGFPPKFSEWRSGQSESIEESLFSDKRISVDCAPTGFGKSQCYMTKAVITEKCTEGGRSCIVTPTKGLQDQLSKDYASMGLVDIRGKDNYDCIMRKGWTCKDGNIGMCSARDTEACPSTNAKLVMLSSKKVVTSYDYWIAAHKYGDGMGKFDHVIFDEADCCPEKVADSVRVTISYREAEEMLGVSFPHPNSTGPEWKAWASAARGPANKLCLDKLAQITAARDPKPLWLRDFHHLKNLVQKLSTISLMKWQDWIWEGFEWGYQFDPISIHRYTESRLFLGVPKISMYSATIREKTMFMMGIAKSKFLFIDHPSYFDPTRSPIYYVPTMKVDAQATDLTELFIRLDQIAGPRLSLRRNGVVHVTSFEYRDAMVRKSEYGRFIISHWDKSPVTDAVERFINSGGILVSPSVSTGHDFKGDECRWQVMTKIPFQPKTKVVKAREEADPLYGPYHAARKLGQMAGRGSRSKEDWCENFILDDHASWFISRFSFLFTKPFLERYSTLRSVPKPIIVGKN